MRRLAALPSLLARALLLLSSPLDRSSPSDASPVSPESLALPASSSFCARTRRPAFCDARASQCSWVSNNPPLVPRSSPGEGERNDARSGVTSAASALRAAAESAVAKSAAECVKRAARPSAVAAANSAHASDAKRGRTTPCQSGAMGREAVGGIWPAPDQASDAPPARLTAVAAEDTAAAMGDARGGGRGDRMGGDRMGGDRMDRGGLAAQSFAASCPTVMSSSLLSLLCRIKVRGGALVELVVVVVEGALVSDAAAVDAWRPSSATLAATEAATDEACSASAAKDLLTPPLRACHWRIGGPFPRGSVPCDDARARESPSVGSSDASPDDAGGDDGFIAFCELKSSAQDRFALSWASLPEAADCPEPSFSAELLSESASAPARPSRVRTS